MQVNITRKGRTTRAEVLVEERVVGVGVASCAKEDHYVEKIGDHLAVARALRAFADDLEKTWDARVVTKAELAERRRLREERRRETPDPEPVVERVETFDV